MAVTRSGRSIVATAASDQIITGRVKVNAVVWSGTGLTATQQLTIKETDTNGGIVFNHYVAGANETVDLLGGGGPRWFDGLFVSAYPAAGTSSVIVHVA